MKKIFALFTALMLAPLACIQLSAQDKAVPAVAPDAPKAETTGQPKTAAETKDAEQPKADAAKTLPLSSRLVSGIRYYTMSMNGQRMGAMSAKTTVNADGTVRLESRTLVKIERKEDRMKMVIEEETVEERDANLVTLSESSVKKEKGTVEKYTSRMDGKKLTLDFDGPGKTFTKTFDIPDNCNNGDRVFFELVDKFKADGKPVSSEFVSFEAESEAFKTVKYEVLERVKFEHSGKQYDGYKIKTTKDAASSTSIVDDTGLPMSEEVLGGLIKGEWVDEPPFDFKGSGVNLSIEIPVDRTIKEWQRLEALNFELTVKDDDPTLPAIFEDNHYQTVKREKGVYTLTLKSTRLPKDYAAPKLPMTIEDATVKKFLEATALCQSDNEKIKKFAGELAGTETDSLKVVTKIVNWAFNDIEKKSGLRGQSSAVEVLEDMEGDCSEHAAIVVALCRAAGVPARVAGGIEYVVQPRPERAMMGYHAWAEAWVGKWIAIDATVNEIGTAAHYIFMGYNEPGLDNGEGRMTRAIGRINAKVLGYKVFDKEAVSFEKATEDAKPAPPDGEKKPEDKPAADKPAPDKAEPEKKRIDPKKFPKLPQRRGETEKQDAAK